MTDLELGWLAGIVDGEGSISLDPTSGRWRYPRISIPSTDYEILAEVKRLLGGCISVKRDRRPNTKPSWTWKIHGGLQALRILGLIQPLLRCPKKRERAKFLFDEYERHTPKNGVYTEAMIEKKLAFEDKFFAL